MIVRKFVVIQVFTLEVFTLPTTLDTSLADAILLSEGSGCSLSGGFLFLLSDIAYCSLPTLIIDVVLGAQSLLNTEQIQQNNRNVTNI